jgi:hypothetical protein
MTTFAASATIVDLAACDQTTVPTGRPAQKKNPNLEKAFMLGF